MVLWSMSVCYMSQIAFLLKTSSNLLQKLVKNCENTVIYGVVLVPLQSNQTK